MSPWHCGDKDHHSIGGRGDIVHKEYGHVSMKIKKPLRTGCTKTGGEGIDEEKIEKIILLGPLYKELVIAMPRPEELKNHKIWLRGIPNPYISFYRVL